MKSVLRKKIMIKYLSFHIVITIFQCSLLFLLGESHNRWTTPERIVCREYFKSFYETHQYPNKEDLERAIATLPELHNRTPKKLKSHLQHDLNYISRCCETIDYNVADS